MSDSGVEAPPALEAVGISKHFDGVFALNGARLSVKAKVTGCDATSEAIAQIQSGAAFLATANQPWPEILDTVIKDMTTFQKDDKLPSKNFDAVDVTIVNKSNAASITPSDKLQ